MKTPLFFIYRSIKIVLKYNQRTKIKQQTTTEITIFLNLINAHNIVRQ